MATEPNTLTRPSGLQLIKVAEARSKTGDGHANFYVKIRDGLLTRPVKIGARASRWPLHEIEGIVKARIAGKSDDDIRALVNELHAQRQMDCGVAA